MPQRTFIATIKIDTSTSALTHLADGGDMPAPDLVGNELGWCLDKFPLSAEITEVKEQ